MKHEAWKQIYIRDQFWFDDFSSEFLYACWCADNNDLAAVMLYGC